MRKPWRTPQGYPPHGSERAARQSGNVGLNSINTARLLTPAELGLYRNHLLRLGAEDRRLRFSISIDDAEIAEFVTHISPWDTQIIARFDHRLAVVAAVQISVVDWPLAELACTVDEAERGRGWATALTKRALLWARNRNIRHACMHFLTDNQPVWRVARSVGMAISTHAGDSEAIVALPRPTLLSIARELTAEQAGLLDYLLKAGPGATHEGLWSYLQELKASLTAVSVVAIRPESPLLIRSELLRLDFGGFMRCP